MTTTQCQVGDIINSPHFKYLIRCRDQHGNTDIYGDSTLNIFKVNAPIYSGEVIFDTISNCDGKNIVDPNVVNNSTNNYKVISAKFGGGGTGHGQHDVFPDCWQVVCNECDAEGNILENGIEIRFNQLTNCYYHTLNEVDILLTESQLSDLYYEEYKAEQYINEMKADGLL